MLIRTVVLSHRAEEQLTALGESFQRIDEAWRGIEWSLATEAESYEVVYGPDVRQLPTDAHGGLPEFNVLYRIESGRVVAEHLETREDSQIKAIFGEE